jgi:hypothetical protein
MPGLAPGILNEGQREIFSVGDRGHACVAEKQGRLVIARGGKVEQPGHFYQRVAPRDIGWEG